MYKNCALALCLAMLVMGMCTVNAKEVNFNQKLSGDILNMTIEELRIKQHKESKEDKEDAEKVSHFKKILQNISSPKRTVSYDVLVNEDAIFLDEESYEILCRIVEAEAGSEDEKGRMLVANVVMNRVKSSRFPDTVKDVVFQKEGGICQFSPVATGSYYRVKISEATRNAVKKVLRGKDESRGALYFVNRYAAAAEYMYWFDTKCTLLFSHGRHEFFS